MEIIKVPFNKLKLKGSKYLFLQVTEPDSEDEGFKALEGSVKKLGILQPLLVHRLGDELHLVDGFKRVVLARALRIKELPCCLLSQDVSVKKILDILFLEHRERVCSSLASRVSFIQFALRLGMDKDDLLQYLFPLLGLKGHEAVLRKVEAIAGLPHIVLDFCDEKGFSMRQCSNLTRYPIDLMLQVFSWKGEIYLTASLLEEILMNLKDHLRNTGQGLSDFLEDREVKGLFASSLNPHERTKQLQALIKRRRFPILTDANLRLRQIKNEMSLPAGVDILWDTTLERKELALLLKVYETEDWEEILRTLRSEKISRGIADLLEIL